MEFAFQEILQGINISVEFGSQPEQIHGMDGMARASGSSNVLQMISAKI